MTELNRRALARLTMSAANVELLYDAACRRTVEDKIIRDLCESHERLRLELAGCETMLRRLERKVEHGCANFNCSICDNREDD